MVIYLTLFSFLCLASFYDVFQLRSNRKLEGVILLLVVIALVIHDGFRWETGTDWEAYLLHFQNTFDKNTISWLRVEKGYSLLVKLITLISHNYTVFLVFHATIVYSILAIVMKEMSPYPLLSFLFYYVIFIGVLGMNRQLLAVVICMYSLKYLVEGKHFLFIIIVTIAATFHISSFILLTVLLFKRLYNGPSYVILIVIAFILRETNIIIYILKIFIPFLSQVAAEKFLFYIGNNQDVGVASFIIGIFRRLPIFIVFFYFRDKFHDDKYFPILLNSFFILVLMSIVFSNIFQVIFARGSQYFAISECLLISRVFVFVSRGKLLAFGFLIIYATLLFFNSIKYYPDLFIPYKGVFINTELRRNLY